MNKLIVTFLIFASWLIFNVPVFANSKYFNYTTKTDNFSVKRINEKYQKRSIEVKNISSIPMKLVWSQNSNDITGQQVYDSTQYYSTIGSQCVAFIGGLTIIGAPFAIHGACEMVKNKNALLIEEINKYVQDGSVKWEYIVQPNEIIKINLIESRKQTSPASIKLRFSGNNGKIIEEINCI